MGKHLAIFDNLAFLDKLMLNRRLCFVGDPDFIAELKEYYNGSTAKKIRTILFNHPVFLPEDYFYIHFQSKPVSHQQIIVASLTSEGELFERLSRFLIRKGGNYSLLKLIGDVYVNYHCRRSIRRLSHFQPGFPLVSFAVVCTPRSGSDYLCELLENTGNAGYPKEYLNSTTQNLIEHGIFSGRDYLQKLMASAVTPNDIFGIKIISHYFKSHTDREDYGEIFRQFRFIYLYRENKMEQAISLYLAKKSNLWHARGPWKVKKYKTFLNSMIDHDQIDYDRIREYHRMITLQEKWLENYIRASGSPVFQIHYNDLLSDPGNTVREAMRFLGVEMTENYRPGKARNIRLKSPATEIILGRMEEGASSGKS